MTRSGWNCFSAENFDDSLLDGGVIRRREKGKQGHHDEAFDTALLHPAEGLGQAGFSVTHGQFDVKVVSERLRYAGREFAAMHQERRAFGCPDLLVGRSRAPRPRSKNDQVEK